MAGKRGAGEATCESSWQGPPAEPHADSPRRQEVAARPIRAGEVPLPGSARPVQAAATIPVMCGCYDDRCRTSHPLDGAKLSDKYSAGMPSKSNSTRRRSTLRSVEVRQELTSRIEEGRLQAGARLPSEPELAAELGVSRATLREALRSLEGEGLLRRTWGSGTFVVDSPRVANSLDLNFGVTDAIRAAGMEAGSEARDGTGSSRRRRARPSASASSRATTSWSSSGSARPTARRSWSSRDVLPERVVEEDADDVIQAHAAAARCTRSWSASSAS